MADYANNLYSKEIILIRKIVRIDVPEIRKPRYKSRLSIKVLEAGIEPALRRTGF